MIRKTSIFFMSLFFLALITGIVWLNATKPRILVLHSYDSDYVWSRDINVGLKRVFSENALVDVRFHEMGTKKRDDADYLRRAAIAAHQSIEIFNPDVLIPIDDFAQKAVAKHYVNHPTMSIVFAGINGSMEPYGYHKANNVTGILERKTASSLQEVVVTLAEAQGLSRKYKPRVLFLADTSHSTEADEEHLQTFAWDRVRYLGRRPMETYADWQKTVLDIEEDADFLLVGGYRQLKRSADNESFVPAREVMKWTEENSPVPVIGMNVFNSEDGAMISVGVSPYEQGETAANYAMQILKDHKKPSEIPVRTASQFVVAMRREALEKRDLHLPKIFESFARATNNYIE